MMLSQRKTDDPPIGQIIEIRKPHPHGNNLGRVVRHTDQGGERAFIARLGDGRQVLVLTESRTWGIPNKGVHDTPAIVVPSSARVTMVLGVMVLVALGCSAIAIVRVVDAWRHPITNPADGGSYYVITDEGELRPREPEPLYGLMTHIPDSFVGAVRSRMPDPRFDQNDTPAGTSPGTPTGRP